jgi:hypothetical protein
MASLLLELPVSLSIPVFRGPAIPHLGSAVAWARTVVPAALGLAVSLSLSSLAPPMMRARQWMTASLAAAALAAWTVSAFAAPAAGTAGLNFTPLTHLAQGNYYGGYTYGFGWGPGYDYKPACPYNYHYTCWYDPYGYRHCGCALNRW